MPKRKKPRADAEDEPERPVIADEDDHIDNAPEQEPPRAEDPDEPEEAEDDPEKKEKARKRRRAVARRKGYRHLANRAGYSATLPSGDASRDVTSNLVSISETARACRWVPRLPNATAYGDLDEYKDRLQLSTEPLPPGPVAVVRANAEVFARKAMNEAVQRTFDAGKTRVSANIMMSVLRPLQPLLRYSFVAPMGLVRHAQTTIIGPADNPGKQAPALAFAANDEAQMKAESVLLPKQQDLSKTSDKAVASRKAKVKKARKEAKDKRDREAAEAAKAAGKA